MAVDLLNRHFGCGEAFSCRRRCQEALEDEAVDAFEKSDDELGGASDCAVEIAVAPLISVSDYHRRCCGFGF